ncbi:uncharacterized protein (DUF2345 family), partial [Undibacterium sp. GrIS 1.8]|uniref:DUF2345 domain-containing protein n=1 Tax=Undibacterium sp. GrIS 1.8 TaxID=3143934 RepID=UPI00339B370E
ASPASTALFAGQHLQWTTQTDSHWAAAMTTSLVSGEATSLFSHAGGIQVFAGNGPLSLQAHTGQLELLADKAITVVSVNDQIEINAKQKITLQAGQSSITLEGANITFACPGNFTVKGGQHAFDAGARGAATLAPLPDRIVPPIPPEKSLFVKYDEQIVYKDAHDAPIADMPIHVVNKTDKTQKVTNKSPEKGDIERLDTASAQPLDYALRYSAFKLKK